MVYITGSGIISSLGTGLVETETTLRQNRSAIQPLQLFPLLQGSPLPVGAVQDIDQASSLLPRTHRLAGIAAAQAMEGAEQPPEAIILGTTTGGILTTEQLLKSGEQRKEFYQYHSLHTVASTLAENLKCTGRVIVVSTACSSGAVAISLAMKMLRSGQVKSVLAGGVDSLCRLTYFGFHSLQLVDQNGCKPLDVNRQGMAVAEGAGMLLLSTEKTATCSVELLGTGLSCDAYHPAAPHPEGQGAFTAMQKALTDAGLQPNDISYINLHGTGTPDNDLAESKAVRRLFTNPPPLSSIKGASGHSLAAAGAIEAVVATITITKGLMPANTGLHTVDPALNLSPLTSPQLQPATAVLSNSFGFGGNNGSLIFGAIDTFAQSTYQPATPGLAIHGYACLTGAGDILATCEQIRDGLPASGMAGLEIISQNLPSKLVRRLKRLPRMTLSLASKAYENCGLEEKPAAVFMGTSWGALSETHDFLSRLTESKEQFPSPTDFVGSVHNGPASQVAILFGATGPNITTSGGDYSFEQALLSAELMGDDAVSPALILGADEGHQTFSPLFDPSITPGTALSDGGGALYVNRDTKNAKCIISLPFYQSSKTEDVIASLVNSLVAKQKTDAYTVIMAGIPAATKKDGEKQLTRFMELSNLTTPIIRYRTITGEFGSASAVAAALAASFLESGIVPGKLLDGHDLDVTRTTGKILILGLGEYVTAMELFRP
ncbi:beta-ketoacyl-[acyl-carrier-protein] synthase family protein [Desulforhopalus sp. IMCC35007]|uniref:beta-ketoacyl-[acyl-carrier-protein] synthase family protein n=1 Tax=Desulforhopalus sp. IMCC35007 TaxID=2569543 RepID=UPI0010AE7774|nr:beta-ketoacyl-[acyl-carrier-protein] synthase family protein [Desulforhopalus sp. IMCC35007]TKB10832.1 3-oxoacyl-ACP synthase [Desulforhopalus sp. IMCC35007]